MACPIPPLSLRVVAHFVAGEAYRVLSDSLRVAGYFILA